MTGFVPNDNTEEKCRQKNGQNSAENHQNIERYKPRFNHGHSYRVIHVNFFKENDEIEREDLEVFSNEKLVYAIQNKIVSESLIQLSAVLF